MGTKMELQSGTSTQTTNKVADGEVNPMLFWMRSSDFPTTKAEFAKIIEPTRLEVGAQRYDQACTLSDATDKFCLEIIWCNTLPKSQDDHMNTEHMCTFFEASATQTVGWDSVNLILLPDPTTEISYIKIMSAGPADLVNLLAKVTDCNFQGTSSDDLYKAVDKKCCELATWTDAGLIEGDGDGQQVTFTQWPKKTVEGDVATHWETGTYESCNCEEKKLVGDQCFVGKTFPGMAFFGYSKGDLFCGASPSPTP